MKKCLSCGKEVEDLRHTCPHCGGEGFTASGDDAAGLLGAMRKQAEASQHVDRGSQLTMQGQFDEAEAELKKAIEINPTNATAHGNMGAVFLMSERPKEAIPWLEKALQLNPNLEGVPDALSQAKADAEKGEQTISNDLITPKNLSKELLASIYEAAYMETSWDEVGDLRVKDQIHCYVLPSEKKDLIQLLSVFGFNPSSSESQRLKWVNNINREYIIVVAFAGANNTLQFKHDLYVEGGITKKNIVLATKRFLSIPISAVQDRGADIVK